MLYYNTQNLLHFMSLISGQRKQLDFVNKITNQLFLSEHFYKESILSKNIFVMKIFSKSKSLDLFTNSNYDYILKFFS